MEEFIKSNYQLIFWVVILAAAVGLIFWFIWRTIAKFKRKKETTTNLRTKRKEVIFEIIKSGESLDEQEVSKLLEISKKEAHNYLIELVKAEKIIMDSDLGKKPRYRFRENK